VQVAQLGTFLRSSSRSRWIGFLPTTPGTAPVARGDLDPLADEDHRVPAADAREVQEALVVDVMDDQADLVDVADDSPGRRGARRGRRGADGVELTSANAAAALAEDGGGSLLVARRAGAV
jgi:hypothetical protein